MTDQHDDLRWFGIRTVYHFGVKNDGMNVFEERVVVFSGKTPEEAHAKAELESDAYAADLDFEAHPEQMGYEQDGDDLIDGYEVWSELFESDEDLTSFYKSRYSRYEYHPEE